MSLERKKSLSKMKKIQFKPKIFKNMSSKTVFKTERKKGFELNFNKKGVGSRRNLKNKIVSNFSNITFKTFRVFDSIVNRRTKVLRRLLKLNQGTYNFIMERYSSFRWLKDTKIIWGLNKYKKEVESLESQGLKRKVVRRRLKTYGIALLDKQKIKNFYFGLREYMLKNMVKEVFLSKVNYLTTFINLLESRLLSFLFRTNLFKSINQLRIFVKLGYILVNNKVITNVDHRLQVGDKVSTNYVPKNKLFFNDNIRKRFSLYYYPSRYVEISLSLMVFLFYRRPYVNDVPYPFNVNLTRILYYYNYKGLR